MAFVVAQGEGCNSRQDRRVEEIRWKIVFFPKRKAVKAGPSLHCRAVSAGPMEEFVPHHAGNYSLPPAPGMACKLMTFIEFRESEGR